MFVFNFTERENKRIYINYVMCSGGRETCLIYEGCEFDPLA
jgi:hypothetical protein